MKIDDFGGYFSHYDVFDQLLMIIILLILLFFGSIIYHSPPFSAADRAKH